MAHDWWFDNSTSFFHANVKTYVGFTKELVRRFDKEHCEPSFVKNKNSNTLYELERPIEPTPLHIFKGNKKMHDSFPRETSPFLEEPSSICEDTESSPSWDDRDQGSLIEDEAFSYMEEEEKDQHQGMMRIHPYLFWEVSAHKEGTALRSEERENSVHSYIQSTSDFDVSLHGGIPPGRPPDLELMRDILSWVHHSWILEI